MQTECGYQFTSKLEGMFTDMKLSSDTMEGFKTYIKNMEVCDNYILSLTVNRLIHWRELI